jgi:hypothetical protein
MRILHIPARTPYARKLNSEDFSVVNQTTIDDREIPRDASFEWLNNQRNFDFFDILHIHSVELTSTETIQQVLDRCQRTKKGIVFTIHDVRPMFSTDQKKYNKTLKIIAKTGARLITLTCGAQMEIVKTLNIEPLSVNVIPHGFVLPPKDDRWQRQKKIESSVCSFGMYGGFRPNREILTPAINIAYGIFEKEINLTFLTRAISPIEIFNNEEVNKFVELALLKNHITLRLYPFPSDDQIFDFMSEIDILIMAYRWGTHSGQLELAFDLGVIPIISNVGYYYDQYEIHKDFVRKPIIFNWSDGQQFNYGSRLMEALFLGYQRFNEQGSYRSPKFHQHRIQEHKNILSSYDKEYQLAVSQFR